MRKCILLILLCGVLSFSNGLVVNAYNETNVMQEEVVIDNRVADISVSADSKDVDSNSSGLPVIGGTQNGLPSIGETNSANENDKSTGIPKWLIWVLAAVGIAVGLAALVFLVTKIIGNVRNGAGRKKRNHNEGETDRNREAYYKRVPRNYLLLQDLKDSSICYEVKIDSEIIIGRNDGDIIIENDPAVSGVHCKVSMKGDLYYLEDLQSSNGTKYDGKRIYDVVGIIPGRVLEIGQHQYRLSFVKKPGEIYHL